MILDCFCFFNEHDILEGRLEYLYDSVDRFIIVEGNITHAGVPKSLNFLNNSSRYKKYLDKILYLPWTYDINTLSRLDHRPSSMDFSTDHWFLENDQRNHISQMLKFFPDDAIAMIGDLDEIPNRYFIKFAVEQIKSGREVRMTSMQDMFVNNFDFKYPDPWRGTVITTVREAIDKTPNHIRMSSMDNILFPNTGWHLTYWGTPESISYKIKNFAHQEYNSPEYTDVERIKDRLKRGVDLFDRVQFIPVSPESIDQEIRNIFGKISH